MTQNYFNKLNKKIVLLITTQRSGSTLLFDSLRYFPYFEVYYYWDIYRSLGINITRRRYPKDLSGNTAGRQDHKIEVLPDLFEYMENLELKNHPANFQNGAFLEKIHPHFLEYNADKIKSFALQHQLKIIFLTRKPLDAIDSFSRYQARNKNWYSNFSQNDVIQHYLKELNFIHSLHLNKDIDSYHTTYDRLLHSYKKEMFRAIKFCGCKSYKIINEYITKASEQLLKTNRKANIFQTPKHERKHSVLFSEHQSYKVLQLEDKHKEISQYNK